MAVAFTGHRTINGKYYSTIVNGQPQTDPQWAEVRDITVDLVRYLHLSWNHTTFICGGAIGFDTVAAMAVCAVKLEGYHVRLVLGLPFSGFDSKWPALSRNELNLSIQAADEVHYVSDPGYVAWKMHKRNEWMVDYPNVRTIVGLYLTEGKVGGTLNCLNYAMKKHKAIITIHPLTLSIKGMIFDPLRNEYVNSPI